jgi:hypothetical protein
MPVLVRLIGFRDEMWVPSVRMYDMSRIVPIAIWRPLCGARSEVVDAA